MSLILRALEKIKQEMKKKSAPKAEQGSSPKSADELRAEELQRTIERAEKSNREAMEALNRAEAGEPVTNLPDLSEPVPQTPKEEPKETKKEARPKTPEEIENDRARGEYFAAIRAWMNIAKGDGSAEELNSNREVTLSRYQTTKKKVVEMHVIKGEQGKMETQEFLLEEVMLKRKFEVENKMVGRKERMVAGVSSAIEKWDKWGEDDKGKKVLKTGISLAMIAAMSFVSVEALAKYAKGYAVSS